MFSFGLCGLVFLLVFCSFAVLDSLRDGPAAASLLDVELVLDDDLCLLCLEEVEDDASDLREGVLPSLVDNWSIALIASMRDALESDIND